VSGRMMEGVSTFVICIIGWNDTLSTLVGLGVMTRDEDDLLLGVGGDRGLFELKNFLFSSSVMTDGVVGASSSNEEGALGAYISNKLR